MRARHGSKMRASREAELGRLGIFGVFRDRMLRWPTNSKQRAPNGCRSANFRSCHDMPRSAVFSDRSATNTAVLDHLPYSVPKAGVTPSGIPVGRPDGFVNASFDTWRRLMACHRVLSIVGIMPHGGRAIRRWRQYQGGV